MNIDFLTIAYLDPGTGSLIMQAVLGGVAGAAVLFRATKQRLFARNAGTDDQATEQEAPATADE